MKFMVDECVGPKVAKWLKEQGFQVFSVYEEARGASDDQLIEKANTEGWILITAGDYSSPSRTRLLPYTLTRCSERL